MDTYVIYADILLLLNFCFDFLLLWAAGRFLRRSGRLARLLTAALVGSAYGMGLLLPALAPLYHPAAAILVSLLLLRIAYPYQNAAAFLRLTGVFYLIAFLMAGAVLAGSELLAQSGVSFSQETVRAGALLAALPVAAIIARRGYAVVKRSWRREDLELNIRISVAGRDCLLSALIDTGNNLREPLSGYPVIVADYKSVETLLPMGLRAACRKWPEQPDKALQAIGASGEMDGWSKRLRLIPFASIGQRHGMLLSFRPDSVTLYQDGKQPVRRVMIAMAARGLGRDIQYQAVLNPELFAESEIIREVGA